MRYSSFASAFLFALLAVVLFSPVTALTDAPTTTVKCGQVQGKWETISVSNGNHTVAGYRGIPFGSSSRWQPPVAADCWEGTLNATSDGPICYQYPPEPFMKQTEDCLSLNVFAPSNAVGKKLPVFVWIYGGSLILGWASMYGSLQNLIGFEECIIVTFNYRLNVFGFMSLEELSSADPRGTSGNYGILDQQLALQWVQDNIASFGGNPDSVTIFGQSSGGTSIFSLLGSPASRGLFHAAISLSGSPNLTVTLEDAQRANRPSFLPNTGCDGAEDVLACLLSIPADKLVAMTPSTWDGSYTDFPMTPKGLLWGPLAIVDGVTVTHGIEEAMRSGLVDVPVIFQSLTAEDDSFPADDHVATWKRQDLYDFLMGRLENWPTGGGKAFVDEVLDRYLDSTSIPVPYAYYRMKSDIDTACGMVNITVAGAQGPRKSPVYLSLVGQPPSQEHGPLVLKRDPLHSCNFPFHTWDSTAAPEVYNEIAVYTPGKADLQFGALLRDSWFQLAKGESAMAAIGWAPVNTAGPAIAVTNYIQDGEVKNIPDLVTDNCDFWEQHGIGKLFWWVN